MKIKHSPLLRIIVTLFVMAIPFGLMWIAGYAFERGIELAVMTAFSLLGGFLVNMIPEEN